MAATSTATFEKMLKPVFEAGRVKLKAYQKNPWLALCPKDESMRGKNRTVPIWYATGQGVSADFGTAKNRKGPGKYDNWVLTRVKGYGLGGFENEVLEASRGDKGAFLQVTAEINGVLHQVTRDLAISMYRTQNGSRGVISGFSTTTSTNDTITLVSRADITNFEAGMYLVASTGGTSAGLATEVNRIRSIDRKAGTMVMESTSGANVNLATSGAAPWAAADTLHREGDITAGSDTLKLAGLDDWLPESVTSTPFFGVDRTVDRERLGGVFVDGSSLSVEDALIEGAAHLHEIGAMPDCVLMGPMQFKNLIRELGSKVQHDIVKSPDMAKIGFRSVKVYTAAGVLDVIADHNCPGDRAYMLTKSTWKLYSMGGAPRVLTYGPGDGARWLRDADDDSVEYRTGWYGQMGCNAPGHNACIKLAS